MDIVEFKEIFDKIRKACGSDTDFTVCAASVIYAFEKLKSKLDITNKHLGTIATRYVYPKTGPR
jgi:hypothetical protein